MTSPSAPSERRPASTGIPHIAVCICTYQRPALLQRLLEKLAEQNPAGAFTISIVIADNDSSRSAERLVGIFSQTSPWPVIYCCEPRKNIALVRNKAVEQAPGDFIAFIDDDEFPTPDWLTELLRTCERYSAAGVLGPVRPHFDTPPPQWIIKGRFCERPEYPTGTIMPWAKCRTGNVLFRRAILNKDTSPFRAEFGTGGEDVDFFQRMIESGYRFIWCNEAPVYETVPPNRWARSFMLKRGLLRGRNNLTLRAGRTRRLLTSLLATPIYLTALPFVALCGQHIFMKFAIRCCDHLGRILAFLGVNPVSERSM